MRTLSATLLAAQVLAEAPAYKIVLTKAAATTYTYLLPDEACRIYPFRHTESPYSQRATAKLDNGDGALTSIDFKGYQAVLSYGATTSSGLEYSATAPLFCLDQQLVNNYGRLTCELTLVGIPNLMALDKAALAYTPASTDTKTIKTLLTDIITNLTGAGAVFTAAGIQSYDIVWDSEDSLIDTYIPADAFKIAMNQSRMDAVRWLISKTKCVMRVESDGKWHVRVPVVSGTTYDYEYTLVEGAHNFFAKAYRQRIVIPAYIQVRSRDGDTPAYTGAATDTNTPALLRKPQYYTTLLTSNAQAQAIAEAYLQHAQIDADAGAGTVPMNCGAEVYDYCNIVDSKQGDSRAGNIGQLTRYFAPKQFNMSFHFGGIELGNDLASVDGKPSETVDYYQSILDLYENQKRLSEYVYNIMTKGLILDAEWTFADGYDPTDKRRVFVATPTTPYDIGDLWMDGSVVKRCTTARATGAYVAGDWVAVGLDEIANGVNFKRTASASLDANGLVLLDQVVAGTYGLVYASQLDAHSLKIGSSAVYDAGYDPSGKARTFVTTPTTPYAVGDLWVQANTYKRCTTARASGAYVAGDWTAITIDEIINGTNWGRIAVTDISDGHIYLSSVVQSASYRTVSDTEKSTYSGKAKAFRQTTAPTTGMQAGDIWFDTDNGDKPYTYTGASWLASYTSINGGDITTGTIDASLVTIQSVSGSNKIVINSNYIAGYAGATPQFYISAADGVAYAGAGAVKLDASGITLDGSNLLILKGSGAVEGYVYGSATFGLTLSGSNKIYISSNGTLSLVASGGTVVSGAFTISTSSLDQAGCITYTVGGGGVIYWWVYAGGAWHYVALT